MERRSRHTRCGAKSLEVSTSQIDERKGVSADFLVSPHDDVTGSAKMLKAAGQVHNIAKHLRTHHCHRTGSDTDAAAGIRLRGSGYFRYSLAYLDCRSHRLIGIILPRLP